MSDPYTPPPGQPYGPRPPYQGYPGPAAPLPGGPPAGGQPVYQGYPQPGPAMRPGPYSPIVGRPLVADEATWGMLSHLSIFALGILGPIILMSTKGAQSPYIRYHAVEALNMHLTLLIVIMICFLTFFLILPILVIFAAEIGAVIYAIMAAMAANRGEAYRYPMIWRMVK